MNIEKKLFPESGELITDDEGNYSAELVDAELDPFDCRFNDDGCVEIDTRGLNYLTITVDNLYTMLRLIEEVESIDR